MEDFDLVEVTHFMNPYLFWIIRINEFDNTYEDFCKKLNEYAQHAETCNVKIGKIYAVKDPVRGIWMRAEIEREEDVQIANSLKDRSNTSSPYKVWLTDEGRPALIATPPRRLSSELRNREPKCERAILFGVSPATCDINQEKGVFEKRHTSNWQINATSVVKSLLSKKNIQVYFRTQKSFESAVVGDLVVISKSAKINIAEYLVEKGIAFLDYNFFFKYQRNYLFPSLCRVDTPHESITLPHSEESHIRSSMMSLTEEFDDFSVNSNKNSSRQSETRLKTNSQVTDNPLDDINDLLDCEEAFRIPRKSVDKEEVDKQLNLYLQEQAENKSFEHVPSNRTFGRGARRRSDQSYRASDTSAPNLSSDSDRSFETDKSTDKKFSSHAPVKFIDHEYDVQHPPDSPVSDSLERSARKKLFDSTVDSSSHKKNSKKLFPETKSLNVIENKLTHEDDFYDSESDETDKNDSKTDEKIKKGKKYLCHKRRTQETASCIAVIKNIEETDKVDEEVIVNPCLEDDRAFLERMRIKEELKQKEMAQLLQKFKLPEKNEKETATSPNTNEPEVTVSRPASSMKASAKLLLKKIKVKPPGPTENVTKNTNVLNISSSSSSGDISTTNDYSTTTSSDETASNTTDKKDNKISWPKIEVPKKRQTPKSLIPAGLPIPQPPIHSMKSKKERHNRKTDEKVEFIDNEEKTPDTVLDKKIKTFLQGRNVIPGDTTSIIKVTKSDQLIHSMRKITPLQNVAQAYLHPDIQDILQFMKITELNGLQSYVWSAVNRGENVVAIWSRSSSDSNYDESSCLMYIPVLCNTVIQNNYDDLGNYNGPIAMILCAHKTAAFFVHKIITELLRTLSLREAMEIQKCGNNKQKLEELKPSKSRAYLLLDNTDFCRGCDFVVTTVKCFLRRVNGMGGHCTDLRRLSHLVLDDGDIITERNSKELNDVLLLCRKMLDRRRNAVRNIQLIVTGEKWNSGIEQLCKETPVKPAICISSHIEAAIYAKVNINLQFIKRQAKIEVLFDLIHKKVSTTKTVVMCNKYDEISEIETILQAKGINVLTLARKMSVTQIKHTFDQWNNAELGTYQLLILSDDILADVQITSAMWLIHYSLPRTWTHFSNRFYMLTDNYQPLFAPDKKNTPKVHIFIDETHQDVIPRMVHFLERMNKFDNSEIKKNLLEIKEKILISKEEKKWRSHKDIPFCHSLLSCGQCLNYLGCKKRHMFFKEADQPQFNIEIDSEIKIRILEIYDSVYFSVRLLDTDNSSYKILAMELVQHYREHPENVDFIEIGKLYAYRKSNNLYERCKVLEKKVDMLKEYYKILLIDTGEKKIVKPTNLRELPERFQKPLPYALEAFVANVKPYDDEIIWNVTGQTRIKELLTNVEINKPNVYVTATVRLIVGQILWLDNIRVFEYFDNTRTTVEKLNLTSELFRERIASKNPEHIPSLMKLCEKAQIQHKFNKNAQLQKKAQTIKKPLAVQYAYLPVGTDFEKVFFLSTGKGHCFYVARCQFNKQYFNLLDDIKTTVTESFYPTKVEIQEEKFCLAAKNDEYFRVQILECLPDDQVVCFLIDEGYEEIFHKQDLKPVFQWMLSRLPAQSIVCRLYGVNYDAEGLEKYEDSDYPLWAKCMKRDPDGTYAILLMKENKDKNISINSVILQEMNSSPVPGETFSPDDFYLKSDASSDSEDDFNSVEIESSRFDVASGLQSDGNSNVLGSDDSEGFDVQIDDVNEFFDKFIKFHETTPALEGATKNPEENSRLHSVTQKSNETIEPLSRNLIQSTPKNKTYIPTVLWYQKPDNVILKIQLAQIEKYELNIMEDSLYFNTNNNGRIYELDLIFYDKVNSHNFVDKAHAFEIIIKLEKLEKGKNWPRLIKSTQRFRHIKVDLNHELSDDEKKPKFKPFLSEVSEIPCDEGSDLDVDFGSDLDNDSSDVETDSSTEAVKHYGLKYAFAK